MRTRASLSWYFYPRPPRGGRRASLSVVDESFTFLSTPSARRATWGRYRLGLPVTDFYPRPPRGGRHFRRYRYGDPIGFLSTPSARRATIAPFTIPVLQIYFYPRPPRGGRPDSPVICGIINYISIHALREEGDHFVHHLHHHPADFYPRPPRGGRPIFARPAIMFVTFLSTPSARRATTYDVICQCFSQISIHALREEGDYEVYSSAAADMIFLSTPSARRATFAWARAAKKRERFLSTPSARRATSGRCPRLRQDRYFYPRPPRGGRQIRSGDYEVRPKFLSTPSARRATEVFNPEPPDEMDFYPRPPRGGRPGMTPKLHWTFDFYPRPPRGGRRSGWS